MSELGSFVQTLAVINDGMQQSLHVGAQIFISQAGQTLLDTAVGLARPGVPMTSDTLMMWMSSTKPVTAVAIAKLWQAGKLRLDDPIATHLPEFAAHGKGSITIRHALTHTGGFRGIASRYDSVPWSQAIAALCNARPEPNWIPGKKAGYHIASSWYVLAEIVQRLSGVPFSDYVRDQIFLPLGMRDSWIGMPEATYSGYGDRIGLIYQTEGGKSEPHAGLNALAATVNPRPAANGRGPIRELGRFYQALLAGLKSVVSEADHAGEVGLTSQTIEAMVARHRTGLRDLTFQLTLDWALGFIPNTQNDDMQRFGYGFGPHASPRAFGHGGNQSSLGMADPEHDLVVAVVFNGLPGETAHAARMRSLMTAIYEDLSLT